MTKKENEDCEKVMNEAIRIANKWISFRNKNWRMRGIIYNLCKDKINLWNGNLLGESEES